MYFRKILCTATFATLAAAAVAKQIPKPYSSEGHEESTATDDNDELAERDAVRTAAWEAAHGGPAPSYASGEEHDAGAWHVAREATGEVPNFGDEEVDVSLEGYGGFEERDVDGVDGFEEIEEDDDSELTRRDAEDEDEDEEGEEIDYSLEGYDADVLQRRDASADDGGEIDYSLEGYDAETEEEGEPSLEARGVDDDEDDYLNSQEHKDFLAEHGVFERDAQDDAVPDFGDEDVDTSLEGYGEALEARDVADETSEVPDFGDEEVDTSLEGYGEGLHARGLEGDEDVGEVPDFGDEEVDISLEGYGDLYARDAADEVPDFGDEEVDTSLEGYGERLLTRDVEDNDGDEYEGYDASASAAYADEPVAEEMEAPAIE